MPGSKPCQSCARQMSLLRYHSSPLAVCFSATVLLITPSPTLQEGSTANLTCVVSRAAAAAESPANFSWFRNGQLWTQSLLPTVTLQSVGRRDAALYACRIWAEAIGQLSAPVILSVLCE